eukprot:GHUV01058359.1.p1 GENE.GHUV01058359.1~~GHUV01058359.1.p1  ORF type:complete len:101 (-),score=17.92 GHUV01058359.1:195-497(-)
MLLCGPQVSYAVGSAVVDAFSRIDLWLEGRRLFSPVLPTAVPEEVIDKETGSITAECRQVSMQPYLAGYASCGGFHCPFGCGQCRCWLTAACLRMFVSAG